MPLSETLTEHFESLHQDAVLWKACRLWRGAGDPDLQALAMEELVKMLLCIANDTKRTAYFRKIADTIGEAVERRQDDVSKLAKQITTLTKLVDKLENKKQPDEADLATLEVRKKERRDLEEQLTRLKAETIVPLTEKEIRKQVNDELKKRKEDAEAKKAKANFEKSVRSADDAGMPEDFDGSMQDVYDAIKYGIYEYQGVYMSRGGRGGGDVPISNFTMKIIYHTDTGDEKAFRLISIKNVYGIERVININTDDFVSTGTFKKVIARRGDFVFKGQDSDLSRLQEYLQKDETSTKYVDILGYNARGQFWAWGNGIMPLSKADSQVKFMPVDEHGIVLYNDRHYFIPACSKMYAEKELLFANEKKFIYRDGPEGFGFRQWNELFLGAYQEKAIAGTLHFIGALFRDIVMKRLQRYPLLNFFGPPQAGKGKMAESMMSMFGHRQDQIMLGGASTPVGFMRMFAQLKNAYVWLDEYKNTIPFKVQESIKNIYDGIGYTRGEKSNDFATNTTPVNSSCLLSGQELPTGEAALFTRIILLSFDDGKQRTDEQKEAFKKLKDIENEGGLSWITSEIVQLRYIVEEQFESTFKTLQYHLSKKLVHPVIDDRFIDNISMLLSFRKIFDKVLPFAFTYDEAEAYMIENIQQHQVLKQGNDDLSKFWQVIEALFYRDEIVEERDFKLSDGYIFIRLQQVHPLYLKEMVARRNMSYLEKSTLEHYLKLDRSKYVDYVRKRFNDGSNTWCYQMKYEKLGIDLIKVKKDSLTTIEQHTLQLNAKYKEMNVHVEPEHTVHEDVPFPVPKTNGVKQH